MTRHRVEWVRAAERDLERIVEFLAVEGNGVPTALDAALRLESALFPRRGHAVPELARLGLHEWLELSVRPWRLIYRVRARRVVLVAVVDARRHLEDVLFERIISLDDD